MKSITGYLRVLSLTFLAFMAARTCASDYYWVGGSGNWSQYATHWATTSGGSTFQTQVPQSTDNVFFDANSFTGAGQTVYIDQTIVNCLNMDWTGAAYNPTLSGPGTNSLDIYGSLSFITNMTNGFYGYVYFLSTTTGQTIRMASQIFISYIYFNSTTGGWTLLDSLTVQNGLGQANISLVNGTLNTNGQNVTAAGMAIGNYSITPTLILGSSLITITGSMNNWDVGNSGVNLNAGTSTINFIGGGQFTGGRGTYYNVNFSSPGSSAINDGNTFNNVVMAGGGYINTSCTFNNLTFTAGNTYTLGGTQTIDSMFTANGNCGGLIFIQGGTNTTIKKTSGSITSSYVFLQKIKAGGGATFTANNSIDGGGNTGWTISTLASRNLYWVGNSGNWSDGSHWSLTSGGVGSGCAPTPVDNVFFDANSFSIAGQTVTVDVSSAYCNNMNWTGASNGPTLAGTAYYYLYIYGSLTLVHDLTNNYNGEVYMVSPNGGNTLTSASVPFQYIFFNQTGGSWTLQDSLTAKSMGLGGGTLNSNNQNINLESFSGGGFGGNDPSQATGTLNLGSSTVTITQYAGWSVYTGMALNAGTSQMICTSNNNPSYFMGGGLSYYNVSFTGSNALTNLDGDIFNNVYIAGSATLETSTYDTLTLSAGKTYSLKAGSTQTITGSLNASGNCGALIFINSETQGTQASVKQTTGNVTVDFVDLEDIKATGGATFTANNSLDGGDNTGWTINTSSPKNLYWVGGTGNWSDGSHWSLSSGGPGSGCTPSPVDNVFFDVNSFSSTGQTVTVDVATAYCNDMNWTGALYKPTFAGANAYNNNLNIYGSLTFITNMTYAYLNDVYFQATTTGKTITTATQNFSERVVFNGIGGEWTLMDDLTLIQSGYYGGEGRIECVNGVLNSNNKNITALAIYGDATGSLILGSSLVTLTYGGGEAWGVYQGFSLDAGTSTIVCSGNGSYMQFYYYTITESPPPITYYDVTFTGNDENAQVIGNANFHNLTFYGDVQISDSLSAGSMFFYNPGHTVTISPGSAEIISAAGQLYALGNGSYPIRIQSATTGSQFTFTKTAGTVCLDYIRLSDSKANGGAAFYAGANSQDLGDNTGWNFSGGSGGNTTVSISSSMPNTICAGSSVTFTATPINAGTPTYNWLVNGIHQQNDSSATYTTSSLISNDTIVCVMISGGSCVSLDTAVSNSIPITLSSAVNASVSIIASQTSICAGTPVRFTASPTNGGSSPNYQWMKNGDDVGISSTTYTDTALSNRDTISCQMISDAACVANATVLSNAIIMTVQPKAIAGIISALPDTICTGKSTIITVTGNSAGVQWQTSITGSNFADIIDADSIHYLAQPAQTTYFRVLAGTGSCSDTSASLSVLVNPLPALPNLSTNDSSLCSYDSTRINASGTYSSYSWSNGDTRSYTYVNQPGDYWVSVTDVNGCSAVSGQQSIAVFPLTAVPGLSTSDSAICSSDTAKITATGGYDHYLWNNGDTSNNTYVNEAGNYWVTVTDMNGCTASSGQQYIKVYPVPSVSIEVHGDTLSSFNSPHYQWYFNNSIIPGATANVYVAEQTGNYAVQVTDSNSCTAISSNDYIVILGIVGINNNNGLSIYPNPVVSTLFINEDNTTSPIEGVAIYDVTGRMILNKTNQSSVGQVTIDVSGLANGTYYIRATTTDGILIQPLVKQ